MGHWVRSIRWNDADRVKESCRGHLEVRGLSLGDGISPDGVFEREIISIIRQRFSVVCRAKQRPLAI